VQGKQAPLPDDRSEYQRLAIPFTFKPQLSFLEAVIAALAAFLRIFLGSLLFAVCGAYTLLAWSRIRNVIWRVAAMVPLTLMFLLLFAVLMLAISAAANICHAKLRKENSN
jgi:hypothetical protein